MQLTGRINIICFGHFSKEKEMNFVKSIVQSSSFKIAQAKFTPLFNLGPKLAPWGLPLVLLGGWMVFPAISDDTKSSLGLPRSKEVLYAGNGYKLDEIDTMPINK